MAGGTPRPLRLVRRIVVVAFLVTSACSSPRPPIALNEGVVVVQNQTSREWRKVIVTVNDHFRAGAASLAPGGRLTAPLSQFQTAFGQQFDRARQSVAKIEVTATDADGKPVSLTWTGDSRKN
jgi:hypothetical protein